MAEGLARVLGKGLVDAHSAGLAPAGVNDKAVAVMKEIGIDISEQDSKEIDEDFLRSMDIVITLCDNAAEACPYTPPDIRRLHWPVKDPAGAVGSEEEIITAFRKTRDEIRTKIEELIRGLED